MIQVGDRITNSGGVDATDIPVGAIVRHNTGVDQKTGEYEVMRRKGRKVLGLDGTALWFGHTAPMIVLSLPKE